MFLLYILIKSWIIYGYLVFWWVYGIYLGFFLLDSLVDVYVYLLVLVVYGGKSGFLDCYLGVWKVFWFGK